MDLQPDDVSRPAAVLPQNNQTPSTDEDAPHRLVLSASSESVVSEVDDGIDWTALDRQMASHASTLAGPAEAKHNHQAAEPWRPPDCPNHALRAGPIHCPACGPYRAALLKARAVKAVRAAERRGMAVVRFDIEATAYLWDHEPIRRTKTFMTELEHLLADMGLPVRWVWALELGPQGGLPHVHGLLIFDTIAQEFTTIADDGDDSHEARFVAAVEAARLVAGSPAGLAWAQSPDTVAGSLHYVLKGMLGTRTHQADPPAHVALNGHQMAHGTTKFCARSW